MNKPALRSKVLYIAWGVVFVASFFLFILLRFFWVSKAISDLAGVPAIVALFGALFQLFRDSRAHERTLQLDDAKNSFSVGATSHMANVAFDKHVEFCEKYTKAVNEALKALFKRGPHKDILIEANKLSDIRTEWTLWLTPEVDGKLFKFEGALRTIGANAWLLGELRADEDRTEPIKKAYGTFAAVMDWDTWHGETVTRDLAAERVIEGLRDVLGAGELTRLRGELVKRAIENLEKKP